MSDLIISAYPVRQHLESETVHSPDWSNPSNITFGGTTLWLLPIPSTNEAQE
ncbi:MAG: hypothetical protein ABI435_02305 [Pseudolysinimonas sp.]